MLEGSKPYQFLFFFLNQTPEIDSEGLNMPTLVETAAKKKKKDSSRVFSVFLEIVPVFFSSVMPPSLPPQEKVLHEVLIETSSL